MFIIGISPPVSDRKTFLATLAITNSRIVQPVESKRRNIPKPRPYLHQHVDEEIAVRT
jgi:hypothetical protein